MYLIEARHVRKDFVTKRNIFGKPVRTITPVLDVSLGILSRGVDVGAKYEIYRIMQDLVKKGKAIIMVSSEMPELLGMSDRIMIMCAGKQTGILGKKEATQIEVMRYATQFDDKTKEGVSV